ncbi:anaerobic sulfatase-maturation protein [Bacteroides sp. UBA939]|uniref:anaerobic sulfatase-maturation protein n=1 Tax=Bacteroides sp. UBA939 TaxID=1946092 RepID=UPI0025B99A17|nr:anaerobic sulfatase-maturation protein [Bacteroides sp. UBA939]
MPTYAPFAKPLYVMLKPVGAICNLACDYCYYLEKSKLYQSTPKHVMSEELLEKFIEEYINSQTMPQVLFTWHGGETLMRPLSFYKKAMELQKKYARGRTIDNCIQTNGTMLTDEWCEFFRENNWLVGVSIDGPQEFHDEYRKNKQGKPSFIKVMQGINLLKKHGVEWNGMAVVNDYNADYPLEFYNFFKEIGCRYIQFAPIVERIFQYQDGRHLASPTKPFASPTDSKDLAELADFSVTPEQWGNFLCTIFDEWVKKDVGTYYIQLFDSTLANWIGEQPGVCTLAKTCGHAGVMEFNGDVYSCDHFVFPEYKLGNIYQKTLVEMMYGEKQQAFGQAKQSSLPRQCRECEWLFACNGECPKNRFVQTASGEPGLNYLCKGYHRFFSHVAPYMDFMKNELMNQRLPANVMSNKSIRTESEVSQFSSSREEEYP